MSSTSSAEQTRREGGTLGAWEGKIKGRSTSVRASRGLHMAFGGTTPLRGVPDVTRQCGAALNSRKFGPPDPDGVR
jgi:hypothetical protein